MGKGGAASEKQEVLINGVLYDVTNLKHPGGSVIKFYAGKDIDATQAFESFHVRSKKAQAMLKALPHKALDEKAGDLKRFRHLDDQDALMKDFNDFHHQLQKDGFFDPSPLHITYRLAEIILMHAAGLYLLFRGNFIPALIILGLATGRCGWLMHEGGHYSLTGNIKVDKFLQELLYGVGCGMSASWWRNQHNKHHSMPQKLGFDVDLNTLPLVAFTEKVIRRLGAPHKLWIALQAFIFPVITTFLVTMGWQLYLHPRHIIRTRQFMEGLMLMIRYGCIYYFLVPHFGLKTTLMLYCAYDWIGGNYIFINFAVSHTHLPVVPKDDVTVDWIRYAAIHTMNVKPGPLNFVNWWMSYLNFQIEHHLFPCMPQFRHPMISKRVKALFEKHGLKYDQRSYTEAMKVTFQNLHKVGMEAFYG